MPLYSIDTFGQLEPFLQREWLLTNGLGGFSFGTVVGCNTRRYHGLLIAATNPPVGRVSILSRLGEMLILDGNPNQTYELAVNQFRDSVHPRGYMYLTRFELGDVATWQYELPGVKITKEVLVPWLKNAVGIRYTVECSSPQREAELRVAPFFALRDFHALRHAAGYDMACQPDASGSKIAVNSDGITGYVAAAGATWIGEPCWWYGHVYPIETDRGQDDSEDSFTPGRFSLNVRGRAMLTFWSSNEADFSADWVSEVARRNRAFEGGDGSLPSGADPRSALGPDYRQMVAEHVSPGSAGSTTKKRSAPFTNQNIQIVHEVGDFGATTTNAPSSASNGAIGGAASSTILKLLRAANDFVVARKTPDGKDGTSVIAGYPWFADWGRDTFISLPGLLLVPGKFEQARQVLTVFAAYVSEGMIPNRFDDYTNEPSYNTVDASLWFVHACFEYARASGDRETFERLLKPACRQIIDGYRKGTRFKIKMDEADGLISQGDEQTQLTWMDAKCNGVAFTPRQGKPVEINALWYHGLVLMGENDLAVKVRENFTKAFWISPYRGLADVVTSTSRTEDSGLRTESVGNSSTQSSALSPQSSYARDTSIRPNQIFAVSLPNSPLTLSQQSAVVEVVRRELLTPFGLRTLAKSDPKYQGRYSGTQFVRDGAYHNGIVWPWLIGGFLEAYLRVNADSIDAVSQARRWLSPLVDAMNDACLGQLAEIYEADEPQRPVGCCAQAWSVAEVLRIAVKVGM